MTRATLSRLFPLRAAPAFAHSSPGFLEHSAARFSCIYESPRPIVEPRILAGKIGLSDRLLGDLAHTCLASDGPDLGRRSVESAEGYQAETTVRNSDFRHAE